MKTSRWCGLTVLSAVLLSALILAPVMLSGCGGGSSPEQAVDAHLMAWQEQDWEAYKASVAPERRDLDELQEELARQEFAQIKINVEGVKMKVDYNTEDKNKATVTLNGGTMTITTKVLGEDKTDTHDLTEKDPPVVVETIKVDDTWYVDKDLG